MNQLVSRFCLKIFLHLWKSLTLLRTLIMKPNSIVPLPLTEPILILAWRQLHLARVNPVLALWGALDGQLDGLPLRVGKGTREEKRDGIGRAMEGNGDVFLFSGHDG